jgi:hypothetical protein
MTNSDAATYEFRVVGHLDPRWSDWFAELAIDPHDDGTCTLVGPVADQAQLHGVLAGLRDIGAILLSVRALGMEDVDADKRPDWELDDRVPGA